MDVGAQTSLSPQKDMTTSRILNAPQAPFEGGSVAGDFRGGKVGG